MTWKDFYAHITNAYHTAGPFYSGPGHHGVDFAVAAHGAVPSYFTGTCVKNGHSDALGNYSVFKVKAGDYRGYAHLLVGTRQDVGAKVKPGDRIGLAAGHGDDHGSSWTGPHCHTTKSSEVDGIWDGNTVNPTASIAAARRATTATPSTAAVTVTVKSGDTLGKIASAHGTTVAKILALPQSPKITNPNIIKVGQRIRVK
jgi:murein DD-endopeptidase MepM/ murein hydrolase activator NlpD